MSFWLLWRSLRPQDIQRVSAHFGRVSHVQQVGVQKVPRGKEALNGKEIGKQISKEADQKGCRQVSEVDEKECGQKVCEKIAGQESRNEEALCKEALCKEAREQGR